ELRGLHAALRLVGYAGTPRAVQPRIQGLLAAVAERHARRVQEGIPSVLHRLLCGHSSLAHVVAVHTPVRQRRPPSSWRNAARRAVAGELMGEHMEYRHARHHPVQPILLEGLDRYAGGPSAPLLA